jgi:hypothetical protein
MVARLAIRWVGVWSVHRRETGPRVIDERHAKQKAEHAAAALGRMYDVCAIGTCAAQDMCGSSDIW